MCVLPYDRNGTGTPVSGSSWVVPAKMTSHCATSSVERPAAVTTRSGVRLFDATTNPCQAITPMQKT